MEGKIVISCLVMAVVIALIDSTIAEVDCSKHPEWVDPKTCCPTPDFITDELKEKCKEFDKGGPPMDKPGGNGRPHPPHHHHHHHHGCFMSCLYNETGILDAEQKLDEAKLNEYLTNTLKDDAQEFIPIVEMAFKTCSVKGEEIRAKMAARKAENSNGNPNKQFNPRCSMAAGFITFCAAKETFKNCPSGLWNDDEKCNALREFAMECKPKFGKHRGPPEEEENAA